MEHGKDKNGVSLMPFYKILSIFSLLLFVLYYHYLASIDEMNDELEMI